MFETGVGIKNPLFFVGVVEGSVDERLEGRVRVRAFGIHGTIDQVPTENLPWAICVKGDYDANGTLGSGLPGENSWVFGVFLDGRDAQQPMVLGLIPTQYTREVDPAADGYGHISSQDAELRSPGRRPEDFGQPQNSKLSRGENIEETYVLNQEMNRVNDVGSGGSENLSWSEPATAYNAEYPYNKVIETPGGNTIELDSTPGAERIMIWHKSGSYTQVDTVGNKTDKSTGDKFEVNDANQHVYVGGRSLVTIKGDSHVLVEGNKTEEIMGDHKHLVHGNYMLSVGSQLNFNSSEEIQARGAQLRFESNIGSINMKAAKGMFAETAESMHFKSGIAIFQDATNSFNVKAGDNIFIEVGSAFNLKAENANIDASDVANIKSLDTRIGGGSSVSIDASEVKIDDIISMANGSATAPGSASSATGAGSAKASEMPEPVSKGTSSAGYRNMPSGGSAGYASRDDADISENSDPTNNGQIPPSIGRSSPVGSPLSEEREQTAFKSLETKERSRRLAAGLTAAFSEAERNSLKAIMVAEGGDYAANIATVLNRSYQARAPINEIVFASKQFTPATSYLTGYKDQVAGLDEKGFRKFVGAYTNNATTSFQDAVERYQDVPNYDQINYFVGGGLAVRYGELVYEAGNRYSIGEGGGFFATGGSSNFAKFQEYLRNNSLD